MLEPALSRLAAAAKTVAQALRLPAGTSQKGRYDRLIDAANRLPRPVLVFGVLALFALALLDPLRFERVMDSLRQMPEELWWLVAAILAGQIGAREAHHLRERPKDAPKAPPHSAP